MKTSTGEEHIYQVGLNHQAKYLMAFSWDIMAPCIGASNSKRSCLLCKLENRRLSKNKYLYLSEKHIRSRYVLVVRMRKFQARIAFGSLAARMKIGQLQAHMKEPEPLFRLVRFLALCTLYSILLICDTDLWEEEEGYMDVNEILPWPSGALLFLSHYCCWFCRTLESPRNLA